MPTLPAHGDTGVNDQIVSQSFQLRAEIVPGCLLGTGGSDATTFGNISFGQISTLPANLDTASTPGNGSIVLQSPPVQPSSCRSTPASTPAASGAGDTWHAVPNACATSCTRTPRAASSGATAATAVRA